MDIHELQTKLSGVMEQCGVEYAGVFGSVARGEDRPDSDVDLLVKFKGRGKFSTYLKLDEEVRQALGRDVDLLTEASVNKNLRPYIENDLKIFYGQRPALSQ